jgi:hypothetical protein
MHIVFWDAIQLVLGAPKFKRELYRSVLGSGSCRLLDFGCADLELTIMESTLTQSPLHSRKKHTLAVKTCTSSARI